MLHIMIDNTAAEKLATSGVTKQMRYLAKTQRIAEGWVRDQLEHHGREDRAVHRCGTGDNLAHPMTKALDKGTHWRLSSAVNLMSLDEYHSIVGYHS